ncbi:MAG: thioredoxin-like domain-containing protein [Marinilabiliaceae bacterium]|nr:thioredoxin-like domain-containing protein [Marinilabiliaceae bacterium]
MINTDSLYASKKERLLLTITIYGVYDSNIKLLPLSGYEALKPIVSIDGIKNGDTAKIEIAGENLPGEFVLRLDYRITEKDEPYPSEKLIIIGDQDLQLHIHPLYSNDADSTWFQEGEKENSVYSVFLLENSERKRMLGLLQSFLLNYDNTGSEFYQSGIAEYEKRRSEYNSWLNKESKKNRKLFAGSLFGFEYIPQVNWSGTEEERKKSLRDNYFEGMDFDDPLLLKTSNLKKWMDGYVNLYGEEASSIEIRDSLFTLAGKTAIEASRKGDPRVYGWMVDYFFNGYESFNITEGVAMLETYINDPNCMSEKTDDIRLRIEGLKTLTAGVMAPDFTLRTFDDRQFNLYTSDLPGKYTLLLFWSADCGHCSEIISSLNAWYSTNSSRALIDIVTISLDETDRELAKWKESISKLPEWTHLRTEEGMRSKVVNDYYLVGIPVMILIDSETKEVLDLPGTIDQLRIYLAGRLRE